MGFHCVGRKTQDIRNAFITITFESQILDLVLNV